MTDEQTEFDVILSEVASDKKIAVLKVVRNITGLGLKNLKKLLIILKVLKEGASKEEGETIRKDIEAAGGKVELK